jgi:hypothetical protein
LPNKDHGENHVPGVLKLEREQGSQKRKNNMKTNQTTKIAALAMAFALTLSFAGSALADGITAPPKTLEFLNSFNLNNAAIVAPVEAQTMKCGMCKNELTTRTDYTARGANKQTVAVVTHACKMCDTQLKTIGVGKAAKTVAVHECGHGCSVASIN